ncbi:DNA helicase/exodeoxyribonuclease V, subunit B [[Clostridium] aminophilum]|uniref:DNA helicase/exodeoxyribonuclease V, subunit B n=1 Tax=[Clostridium] aminophilum TaxID=1526 RepID=A0A1I0FVL9_9FIRM|nr:PD-(D/E)XK nuclease family protein [[Clostridium] aminophilum]SET62460.1 DNA helicase/exodeoxyribonuclease V, subunit B [[Clostridium] aminophilum]
MSLRFIIGGSGSGKTTELYRDLIRESMENPERRYYAIVPEQFTMQTQKEIVDLHPNHAVMNIDILSFERLAYRVFEELAVRQLAVLDDMGKAMVIRKTAAGVRDELRVFGRHLDKPGFIDEIKSQLSEFFQYGIREEQLVEMRDTVSSDLLRAKLSDMLTVTKAYHEYTKDKMASREEIPEIFCSCLPQSELLQDAVVTLDGFTGFTPVQYHILEILLKMCAKVTVTVTMDAGANPYREGAPEELFHLSRRTVCRLIDIAAAEGVRREEDLLLGAGGYPRFQDSPELQAIERSVFRRCDPAVAETSRAVGKSSQNGLFLVRAANPIQEVSLITAEISRLVRTKSYRYRDIAVITGALDSYRGILEHAFAEEKIPCFIDSKKSIMENPATELIRAALEVISSDFSYESVFRYLKTGLVLPFPDGRGDAGEGSGQSLSSDGYSDEEWIRFLENYVAALGIRGFRRWNSEWKKTYPGADLINLNYLNYVRKAVLTPFLSLKEAWGKRGVTVTERTAALTRFLEELKLEEKLRKKAETFGTQGNVEFEREYSQVYGLIIDLFDRTAALLGDEKVSRDEYRDILDAGFAEIKVGLIPAAVDRVVVGDITRTRLAHIKVLFFAGVNDGIVPAVSPGTGILSESERRLLRRQNIEIAPTAREDGFLQRFYLYLALTKASEKLYVTFSTSDTEGKVIRPSTLIAQLRKMFPEKKIADADPKNLAVWSRAEGMRRLAGGLRDGRDATGDVLELYRKYRGGEQTGTGAEVSRLVDAAFLTYTDKGIGKAAARLLYSPILRGSISRLEKYDQCAYAHFLQYGLNLSERRVYQLKQTDIGSLFHASIELYFRALMEEKRAAAEVTESERIERVRDAVSKAAGDYGNSIMDSSARNRYLIRRMTRIADRTAWALTEQIRRGDFVPEALEMAFTPREGLETMRIALGGDEFLDLHGRIDRVDLCEDENDLYLKIIDYKTGQVKFDLRSIYYGLSLQLPVYMEAALEKYRSRYPGKSVHPAGMFYYRIQDPLIDRNKAVEEETRKRALLEKLKMNGAVNADGNSVRHLDHGIAAEGTENYNSPVISAARSKDGAAKGALVFDEDHFRALGKYCGFIMQDAGRKILEGSIEINPYKDGMKNACEWCPYHAVCGFDAQMDGFSFRKLPPLKAEDIWPRIGKKAGIAFAGEDRKDEVQAEGSADRQEKNAMRKKKDGHEVPEAENDGKDHVWKKAAGNETPANGIEPKSAERETE